MPIPFRIFKETNTSPDARFLRTSYGQKIIDAFFAFAGSWNLFALFLFNFEKANDPNNHTGSWGILDLPIFFIPTILDVLTALAWESNNAFIKFGLGSILGLIAIPLNLIRIVIAGILAFNPLSLMIILVIHAISQYACSGAELNEKVARIEEDVVFYNKQTQEYKSVSNGQKFMSWDVSTTFESAALPPLTTQGERLTGLTLKPAVGTYPSENIGFFYLPFFIDDTNTTLTKSAYSVLKLNTWRVTEGMETYVERNHNDTDAEIKKTLAYCEQVLKLIK